MSLGQLIRIFLWAQVMAEYLGALHRTLLLGGNWPGAGRARDR